MSEPVFFKRGPGLTVEEIVALTGARLAGLRRDGKIFDVATVERAGPHDLTFVDRPSDETIVRTSQAGACFVRPESATLVPASTAALLVADPYAAFVTVTATLYPQSTRPSSLFEAQGRAASALVHPSARLEAGVTIDPGAVIGPRAEIGSGTLIGSLAVVGPDVRIGRDCSIGAGVGITNALIGDRVDIHAGCRIGEAATAWRPAATSPQVGRVIIQDRVEIGANSTVDRGSCRDTVIGECTRVDDLVHIASDVMIGRHCAIVSRPGGHSADTGPDETLTFPDGTVISAAAVGASRQQTGKRAR